MHGHTLILIVEDDPELGARLTRDVRRYADASAAELVVPKVAGSGPRALEEALRTLPRQVVEEA